ncbi:FMN-binding protein (plasmid) [Bradyrhizobium sp. ISRA443]|uniref:FMN-binding protein n=1 Tax=unclassified Bradyrhizobium TaxID=2631580 RepID=UPI00247968A9|nr:MULTISPECIES: FMN-binding protein [unclassified Bradyrhizobium]WGR90831.1 FMN-binding protein [Bradyrhizobium sp. ISRA435]WGS03036.1 FMN-binding protein [Bradyrhizobium sp. ISRA436]WGS09929.1 FMN-binding protein [Bradyrhizobium sp. ISRA437]WGS16814.1 FMN-binding protein [Bradyrhizobium sp. ISRA443]
MTWVRYTLPAAAIVSVASPAYAVRYLSIAEAQKQAFPSATQFTEVQAGRVWKAEAGGKVAGFFIIDRVIGKHLFIDYAVALTPGGAVHKVEILEYLESYGGEIRSPSWLTQFVGKSSGSALKINGDIRNISGATLSSRHVTEGVKRILTAYANRLR